MQGHFNRLRVLVILLLAVFFADTVYASTRMLEMQMLNHNSGGISHLHCQLMPDKLVVDNLHSAGMAHPSSQKSSSTSTDCHDCLACLSMLPGHAVFPLFFKHAEVGLSSFKLISLSHISEQPQRPPIS